MDLFFVGFARGFVGSLRIIHAAILFIGVPVMLIVLTVRTIRVIQGRGRRKRLY